MTKYFNIDVENIVTNHDLSYQNINDQFMYQIKQLNNHLMKLYAQKIVDTNKISIQVSDITKKLIEDRGKLKLIEEKVESELQSIQTENNRLESINNECRLLEVEENELKDVISLNKVELTQVFKEKKGKIKKIKREINSFKSGVNMYQKFLQMDMSIKNQESNAIINITLKNLNTNSNYSIVLEENDKIFKLIDINPRSPLIMKASALYNQNKDIQGLLAFLSNIKE